MGAGVTLTMGSGQDTIKDADTTLHWRPGVNWFLSVVGLYQWSVVTMSDGDNNVWRALHIGQN